MNRMSLLVPEGIKVEYKKLSEETIHDLAVEDLCSYLSQKEPEQKFIRNTMTQITALPEVVQYRCDIFDDILHFPKMREQLLELLNKVDFIKDYGNLQRETEASGMWDLMHKLDQMKEYIECVEAIYKCLNGVNLTSKGLIQLRDYAGKLYNDKGFRQLKEDVTALKADTSNLRSVTLGINLNQRFEAINIGVVSVNSKYFTKSNVVSKFSDFMSSNGGIKKDTEWNEEYSYRPISMGGIKKSTYAFLENMGNATALGKHAQPVSGLTEVTEGDSSNDIMRYMDKVVNQMLSSVARKLRDKLLGHISLSIYEFADLIPELIYYIRWAEYVELLQSNGLPMCKPELSKEDECHRIMRLKGGYNIKLAQHAIQENETIVPNDLTFDDDHRIYILTGANRGGKTTITQAIGILFLMAQGGIYVPADSFTFHPVDSIYTHFPADEDKTMDLGRLGEECKRFKDIFTQCTSRSLLLLNETFSTTSFEEGYFIAFDAIRAMRNKGLRTIYNTHMHKLGREVDKLNKGEGDGLISSIVTETLDGNRSYRVIIAPPDGMSFANDIAKRYGVTYDQLLGE